MILTRLLSVLGTPTSFQKLPIHSPYESNVAATEEEPPGVDTRLRGVDDLAVEISPMSSNDRVHEKVTRWWNYAYG
jgi:hypothetical protein